MVIYWLCYEWLAGWMHCRHEAHVWRQWMGRRQTSTWHRAVCWYPYSAAKQSNISCSSFRLFDFAIYLLIYTYLLQCFDIYRLMLAHHYHCGLLLYMLSLISTWMNQCHCYQTYFCRIGILPNYQPSCRKHGTFHCRLSLVTTGPGTDSASPGHIKLLNRSGPVFSTRCNIYISHLCYNVSVRLSVTEVHWHIIANLGFKLRSQCTTHCGRGACGRKGRDHRREEWRDHLVLC